MAEDKKEALAQKNPVLEKGNSGKVNLIARLPKGVDKEKFFLGLMTAIQRSKATAKPGHSLADCDPTSVLLAAYDAAEVGCSLSPSLQLGWLIPYGREAQFQPSYRFFIQKAYETKEVKTFFAEVVYKTDKFERQYAPKKNLFHAPGDGERTRKEALGAYALVEFSDGTIDWEYMTTEQIERHRSKSKQPDSMKWTAFWEEGFRITPIRVIAKRLPIKNRDLEGLVEMVNRDTERETITLDEVASLPSTVTSQPRRLSETEAVASPASEPEKAQVQQAEKEKPKPAEQAKSSNGGTATQAAQGTGGSMFGEEDPFLNPAEIKEFWDRAFAAGWKRNDVSPFLSEHFKVAAVKDLHHSQLPSVLDAIEAPESGSQE